MEVLPIADVEKKVTHFVKQAKRDDDGQRILVFVELILPLGQQVM